MALSFAEVQRRPPAKGGFREGYLDVTFDNTYPTGGWTVTPSSIGLSTAIHFFKLQSSKIGYVLEEDHQSGGSVKIKAYSPGGGQSVQMPVFGTWAVDGDGAETNGGGMVGDVTLTEQAATFCQSDDGGTIAQVSTISAEAGYTADYQLFPDTPAADDAAYFGAAVPFAEMAVDTGTVATYDSTGVLGWEYYDGTTWSALTISYDGTHASTHDGTLSFARDGAIVFVPPSDWAATTVNSQSGYWIRCVVQTGKAANMTQVPILNSKEHELVSSADPFMAPYTQTITGIRLVDGASTLHTATDVKFIVVDTTTGAHSGELTFAQDKRQDAWSSLTFAVTRGDSLSVIVTQEDGTNEVINATVELIGTSPGQELANGSDLLSNQTARLHYVGT